MNVLSNDRVGISVLCEVRHGSREETCQGYVRWTHASEGQVISRVETIGEGWADGPWVVEKVDVPFKGPYA